MIIIFYYTKEKIARIRYNKIHEKSIKTKVNIK